MSGGSTSTQATVALRLHLLPIIIIIIIIVRTFYITGHIQLYMDMHSASPMVPSYFFSTSRPPSPL